jgi:hypothetical protein
MDDEKSIAEKLTDAITKATDSVKSTMSNIVDTASHAAQYAMENNSERMSGQTATGVAPEQIAATANEQVYIPVAADAVAMPAPLVAVQPMPRKRVSRTKLSSGKMPPAKKAVAKKSNKKAGKTPAKKAAKKSASRKSKKGAKKSAIKKTAKQIAKKSTKKAKNKKAKKKTKKKTKR